MGSRISLLSALVIVLAPGCGDESDVADVAGDYTIAMTYRENGCGFQDWQEGGTASGIPLSMTQDGDFVAARVEGVVGFFLDLVLGVHTYTGHVDGSHIGLELHGTRAATQAGCTYTVTSEIDATLSGDVVTGEITYTTATNGSPDCGALEGCLSRQEFNGTRPPQ